MALKESNVSAVIESFLEEGEQLKNYAFGVNQNPFLAMFGGVIGVIGIALFNKYYLVGLTDRRFLVLRYKGKLKVTEISEYSLRDLPEVKTFTGPIFTDIRIKDPRQPFVAKFFRSGMKNNLEQSAAIVSALTSHNRVSS